MTTASITLLAAVVSYGHMHALVLAHGEGSWASALIPLSVDGMIAASSMSLLLESRLGGRGGVLPWALLTTGGEPECEYGGGRADRYRPGYRGLAEFRQRHHRELNIERRKIKRILNPRCVITHVLGDRPVPILQINCFVLVQQWQPIDVRREQ